MADALEGEALELRLAATEEKAGEMFALLMREAAVNGHDAARIASDGGLLGIMRWFGTLQRGHDLVAALCEEYGAEAQRFMALEKATKVPTVLN